MPLQLVRAPQDEPYTREEAKVSWRVTIDDDDELIDSLISASREHAEVACHRQILTATYALFLDTFPYGGNDAAWLRPNQYTYGTDLRRYRSGTVIRVPRPPLQSVIGITYIDGHGDTQTLSPTAYGVDTFSEPGRIYLNEGFSWPGTRNIPNAVRIEFVAGWENADAVPRSLMVGMKLLGGHWYESREATMERMMYEVPMGARTLFIQNKVIEMY